MRLGKPQFLNWFRIHFSEYRIKTSISYVPALQPFPASLKRQQAYEAAALIPNPFNDPDGWFSVGEAPIVGIFDGQENGGRRKSKVNCKVSMFYHEYDFNPTLRTIQVVSSRTGELFSFQSTNNNNIITFSAAILYPWYDHTLLPLPIKR